MAMMVLTLRKNHSLKPPTKTQTMLIQTKHILTTLVVAGISIAALPAKAATFVAGDLLVGFRATSGSASTATTNTFVFNLGAATTIRDANTASLALGNVGAELTNVFGADWASNSTLTWAAATVRSATAPASDLTVVNGDPAQALYLTRPNSSGEAGVFGGGTLNIGGATAMTNVSNNALGYTSSFRDFAGATTQGGLAASIPYAVANTFEDYTGGGSDFGSGQNLDVAVNTAAGRIIDLYRILGTNTGANPSQPTVRTGVWQGTLSLGTDGAITFDPVAVAIPEPSRALLSAGGLAALAFRRRRRRQA
jgi:hypothetical protein